MAGRCVITDGDSNRWVISEMLFSSRGSADLSHGVWRHIHQRESPALPSAPATGPLFPTHGRQTHYQRVRKHFTAAKKICSPVVQKQSVKALPSLCYDLSTFASGSMDEAMWPVMALCLVQLRSPMHLGAPLSNTSLGRWCYCSGTADRGCCREFWIFITLAKCAGVGWRQV